MTRDGRLNGPRRFIYTSDLSLSNHLSTRTYKDGRQHGLTIYTRSSDNFVTVFREGYTIFRLYFTKSGEETLRDGSEMNSFSDVDASTFLK